MMATALDIASWVLLTLGGISVLIGGIGALRMPNLYTRMHAASVTDTMGAALVLGGYDVVSSVVSTQVDLHADFGGPGTEEAYASNDPTVIEDGSFPTLKVVGGYDRNSLKAAVACYEIAIDIVVPVSSCEAAEACKILENTYRAVNIALVNELKVLLAKMGIDVWEVIEAAATKPFGFTPYYPGPGLGGHCIPIDPFYLSWLARNQGNNARFIELAGDQRRVTVQS